jgi:hypothetical protein
MFDPCRDFLLNLFFNIGYEDNPIKKEGDIYD